MKTVLLVDDEFALVDTLRDFLEEAGYRVERADDGAAGLEAMQRVRPDLVISDVMMPVMGAKEMLTAMRADPALAAIPVVLMSAARRQIAVPVGQPFPEYSMFLRKPFRLDVFLDAVTKLIGPATT